MVPGFYSTPFRPPEPCSSTCSRSSTETWWCNILLGSTSSPHAALLLSNTIFDMVLVPFDVVVMTDPEASSMDIDELSLVSSLLVSMQFDVVIMKP